MSSSVSTTAETKRRLRSEFRARLARHASSESARFHQLSLESCLADSLARASGVWAAYCPLPGEPDPRPALPRREGLRWAFPRVEGDSLEFLAPDDHRDERGFEAGAFGVVEPVRSSPRVRESEIAGFLVPGLAFDRAGGRLGRGKGFYDRVLALSEGFRMGIAFASQIAEEPLPREGHDARMDAVVTEDGIIWAGSRRP